MDWVAHPLFAAGAKLVWDEDFDGTLILNADYVKILVRSVLQAGSITVICGLLGLPVALWRSSLTRGGRDTAVLLITVPFWTNLLVRNFAWLILPRDDGATSRSINAAWLFGPVQLLNNGAAITMGLVYSFLPFMILAQTGGAPCAG